MRSAGRDAYACALLAIALVACYDVPRPACGFQCGPPALAGGEGTCPDGYVCFTNVDNRCHRVSPPFTDDCPGDAAVPVDLKPPLLGFRSPAPDDTNVPLGAIGSIEVGFDELVSGFDFPNVVVEEGALIVTTSITQLGDTFDNLVHYRIDILSSLGVQRPFASATMYTVRLSDGITDFAGNAFLGDTWSFTTEADTTPPMATLQTPSTLVNVGVGTLVVVTFSEPVLGVNTATLTLTGPAGQIGSNLSTNGSPSTSATLDPFSNLQPATQYTIALSAAITDLAGNALSFTPIAFTTAADTTPPMVSSTNPANGMTNVAVSSNLAVGFSETVSGVNSTTFTLTGPLGLVTAQVASAGTTATLNPIHQLLPNTTYNVALTSAILDLASNPLVAFAGTFTTGADDVPPSILVRSPLIGATNVAVNAVITADFDEHVTNANDTTIQLVPAVPAVVGYTGAPTFRATLTPSVQLAANTMYTVTIASTLEDATGNMFGTPPVVWTFMTGADTVVPAIVSTAPADNAIDVPLDATISVTFDEPVTNVDGTTFVVMNAGTGTYASSNGDRTWTFTPDTAMPANTTVTILLSMGIEDPAGNALAPFAFDFTTVP
ncbi:MAG: Ig-like domain-containing protein [Kofleriaceae bacterium]